MRQTELRHAWICRGNMHPTPSRQPRLPNAQQEPHGSYPSWGLEDTATNDENEGADDPDQRRTRPESCSWQAEWERRCSNFGTSRNTATFFFVASLDPTNTNNPNV
mmetsp:Transcript_19640/g.54611  ORF Transcript_19640/g.54611 Transcript_19640/m.54611 type:complete len:106 (-) Transcript_19640:262-579(-)